MTIKTPELNLWEGEFGDEYRQRNEVREEDIVARSNMWEKVIASAEYDRTRTRNPSNILEVGCGQGINLIAINYLSNKFDSDTNLTGIEPNSETLKTCEENCKGYNFKPKLIQGNIFDLSEIEDYSQDMVFTSGVLIHINPKDQVRAISELYKKSRHLIICAEYFNPTIEEKIYHGEKALWKRDYGSLWLDNFPMRVCGVYFVWKRITGIDNLTVWVFEKTQ